MPVKRYSGDVDSYIDEQKRLVKPELVDRSQKDALVVPKMGAPARRKRWGSIRWGSNKRR